MITQNIFTPVALRSDRERIFSRLVGERGLFDVQYRKNHIVRCRAFERDGGKVRFDSFDPMSVQGEGKFILTFSLGAETLFMNAVIGENDKHYYFHTTGSIFRLQRRDNFRLSIPSTYRARFELRTIDLEDCRETYSLFNLSGGGLNFEIRSSEKARFLGGSHASGILKVDRHLNKPVTGTIRHRKEFGSMGSGIVRIGLEFDELSFKDREEIIGLVMKIHRTSFSKLRTAD